MSERPDWCYRWVIAFDDGSAPFIAYWCAGLWVSMYDPDDEDGVYVCARVHKVGVGGTLDAPPDVWVDDLPEGGA